jgi:hypothetical protein
MILLKIITSIKSSSLFIVAHRSQIELLIGCVSHMIVLK